MFTGLVEELGEVVATEGLDDAARLRVRGTTVREGLAPGDSVSVDGACLTVAELHDDGFTADVMGETLRRTTTGDRAQGDPVNLERSLAAGGRLGGHVVLGHVDGVGEVVERSDGEHWTRLTVRLDPRLSAHVVEKGSITVSGVSLTVTEVGEDRFSVGLIPETLGRTTLGAAQVGTRVNLETDVVAKHVERLVERAVADRLDRLVEARVAEALDARAVGAGA